MRIETGNAKHLSAHSTNLRSGAMGQRQRTGPIPIPADTPPSYLLTPLPQLPRIPIGLGYRAKTQDRRPKSQWFWGPTYGAAVRYRQSCNCRSYPASGSHQRRCHAIISCSVCMNLNLDHWSSRGGR